MKNLILSLLILSAPVYSKTLEEKIAENYDLQNGRGISLLAQETKIRKNIMNGLLADMGTQSIEGMVTRAATELDNRGYHAEAADARAGWAKYHNMVYEMRDQRPVGDHPGVIWLLNLHQQIENLIGIEICEALRIHDMWKIGMTVGVVFRCQDNVPPEEYFEHFSMFVGVVSYWVTDIACMAFTPVPFVCGFAGMGVEKLVVLFVVPHVQQSAFNLACRKGMFTSVYK